MVTRSTTKVGVGNASQTSASKARTARGTNKNDGTAVDQSRSSRPAVSGKTPASVGTKGTGTGLRSAPARKTTSGYSAAGHSGGSKLGPAPKLGTSTAVSGTPGSYGTAPAKNNSHAGSSGAVSGKSESYGTAPAKQVNHGPYGTWTGK